MEGYPAVSTDSSAPTAPTDPQEIAEWFSKRKRVSAAIASSLGESLRSALASGELARAALEVAPESAAAAYQENVPSAMESTRGVARDGSAFKAGQEASDGVGRRISVAIAASLGDSLSAALASGELRETLAEVAFDCAKAHPGDVLSTPEIMQSGTIDPQEIAPTDPQEIAEWFNKRKRVSAAIAASLEESLSAALSSGELEKAFAKVVAESDAAGCPESVSSAQHPTHFLCPTALSAVGTNSNLDRVAAEAVADSADIHERLLKLQREREVLIHAVRSHDNVADERPCEATSSTAAAVNRSHGSAATMAAAIASANASTNPSAGGENFIMADDSDDDGGSTDERKMDNQSSLMARYDALGFDVRTGETNMSRKSSLLARYDSLGEHGWKEEQLEKIDEIREALKKIEQYVNTDQENLAQVEQRKSIYQSLRDSRDLLQDSLRVFRRRSQDVFTHTMSRDSDNHSVVHEAMHSPLPKAVAQIETKERVPETKVTADAPKRKGVAALLKGLRSGEVSKIVDTMDETKKAVPEASVAADAPKRKGAAALLRGLRSGEVSKIVETMGDQA